MEKIKPFEHEEPKSLIQIVNDHGADIKTHSEELAEHDSLITDQGTVLAMHNDVLTDAVNKNQANAEAAIYLAGKIENLSRGLVITTVLVLTSIGLNVTTILYVVSGG